MNALDGTWLSTTGAGIVLMRLSTIDGVSTVLVDRPAQLQFRQPAGDQVVVRADGPVLADPAASTPRRVLDPPAGFAAWCGWYRDDAGRTLLLTQCPEADLGEPMILVQDGDAVIRAYPVDDSTLIREDGVEVRLDVGRVRLVRAGVELAVLSTSDSYRERPLDFAAGPVELRGTLITPATPGPHPAAVVVHGAAGGQRDYGRIFATALLEAGVAALIYDKPGYGLSTGDASGTIFDRAAAASAAVDALAAQPDIDPARIGLAGFSNGMWSAPMVAATRPEVAFLTGIGSPGVSMLEAEVHRRIKVLRAAGIRPTSLVAVERAWRLIFTIRATGDTADSTTARLRSVLSDVDQCDDLATFEVPAYARNNPQVSPIPPSMPAEELMAMLAGPPDPESVHDPVEDYRAVTAPVFLQYGEQDTSVPVAGSVERIAAVCPTLTVRRYPDLDHTLNLVPTGVIGLSTEEAMYLHHGFRFGPGVWADLTSWLRTAVATD